MNPLYKCGFSRVGCIGCPMAGKHRKREFLQYPAYELMYRHAFARMLEVRKAAGRDNSNWKTADDVFDWWMGAPEFYGQTVMDEFKEATEQSGTI